MVTFYYLLDDFRLDRCSDLMTSSHFYELLSTFPSWLQDDCHNSRHHILIHQCSKTGRKWGGWALFLLVSLLLEKKKSFLDTQHISFYISYIQILIAREADIKIQHLVPLVAKRLCQQGDQLNKNGDQVRSCWEQVAGLHLTGCAATNTWSSLPRVFCGPHTLDCSWEQQIVLS